MSKIYHTNMADALPSKKRVAEEKARLEKAVLSICRVMLAIDMLISKTKQFQCKNSS